MKSFVNKILKKTPCWSLILQKKHQKELVEWKKKGKPVPPPHIVKQQVLMEYAEKYGLIILIETGTLYGDMVAAMRKNFDSIFSFELSDKLFQMAVERFKNENNITIIHGDSGIELKKLMIRMNKPTLFWLDGHFSGGVTAKGIKDTPIYEELTAILKSDNANQSVIIIDDARCFGTDPSYPSIEVLCKFVKDIRPEVEISVKNDMIRIAPKNFDVDV